MQNEKMFINLAPGQNEIILREGAAPKVLDPKAPVKINIEGIITAPCEFLNKRINTGQFEQKDCHIIVNREEIKISLVVNESDEYKRGVVVGKLRDFDIQDPCKYDFALFGYGESLKHVQP